MKLLWITNILFPDISKELGSESSVGGGWMKSSAFLLLQHYPNIELAVAACYNGDSLLKKVIKDVTYYCLPSNRGSIKYTPSIEPIWQEIRDEFQPNVVHIHGTEFSHGLGYIKACGNENVVISIQGLVSGIARYETASIPQSTFRKKASLRHILKGELSMHKRGQYEMEYLKLGKHFIGRTDWDRAHIWAINPDAQYHFCNETLRKPFYFAKWGVMTCERHRIFLSQAAAPLKGLHKMIEALPYILRSFPDIKVYVAGSNFIQLNGFKDKIRTTTYANIIRNMIKERGLEDKIVFTGSLDEVQMVEQFEKAHVFVCPSSIENSPNSLGEAQLVGTPSVASFVGGIPQMVEHGKSGLLYRFEEHEMLAKYVCDIFADDDLASLLSDCGRTSARLRHDEKVNTQRLYNIYKGITQ